MMFVSPGAMAAREAQLPLSPSSYHPGLADEGWMPRLMMLDQRDQGLPPHSFQHNTTHAMGWHLCQVTDKRNPFSIQIPAQIYKTHHSTTAPLGFVPLTETYAHFSCPTYSPLDMTPGNSFCNLKATTTFFTTTKNDNNLAIGSIFGE